MDDPLGLNDTPQPLPSSAPPPQPQGVVIQRRLTAWSPDGTPIVKVVPFMTKAQIGDITAAAISLPYEGPEPEYQGQTNAEVMLTKVAKRAAFSADIEDVELLLDRSIGKAKQLTENLKVTVTYEDYLKDLARRANPATSSTSIDAEVVIDADANHAEPSDEDPLA